MKIKPPSILPPINTKNSSNVSTSNNSPSSSTTSEDSYLPPITPQTKVRKYSQSDLNNYSLDKTVQEPKTDPKKVKDDVSKYLDDLLEHGDEETKLKVNREENKPEKGWVKKLRDKVAKNKYESSEYTANYDDIEKLLTEDGPKDNMSSRIDASGATTKDAQSNKPINIADFDDIEKFLTEGGPKDNMSSRIDISGATTKDGQSNNDITNIDNLFQTNVDDMTTSFSINNSGVPIGRKVLKDSEAQTAQENIEKLKQILAGIPSGWSDVPEIDVQSKPDNHSKTASWKEKVTKKNKNITAEDHGI